MRFFRLNAATLTLWAVLAFLFATPFSQQTAYGQDVAGMTGTVVDQSGAAVPNV